MVYATVIIFDFRRTNFVKNAIGSIKADLQGLEIELILLKSYRDKYIEEFLNDNNVRYIDLMEAKKQSDYIKMAINVASGEIIIFMDDDDLFYPEKIRHIIDIFQTHKNLGYYHNNFDTINVRGENIRNKNYKTPRFQNLYLKNTEKSKFFQKSKNLRLLLKIRPDFNSSSITIRKNIFSNLTIYNTFNDRIDSFMFAIALLSSMDIFLDNKILTHYRIHENNGSVSMISEITKLRKIFIKSSISGITVFSIIKSIMVNTEYERYIQLRLINLKLGYNFWTTDGTFKIGKHDILMILRIDFIHELEYLVLSKMPNFIKLEFMKRLQAFK
jgi:hypothetical protein